MTTLQSRLEDVIASKSAELSLMTPLGEPAARCWNRARVSSTLLAETEKTREQDRNISPTRFLDIKYILKMYRLSSIKTWVGSTRIVTNLVKRQTPILY